MTNLELLTTIGMICNTQPNYACEGCPLDFVDEPKRCGCAVDFLYDEKIAKKVIEIAEEHS